MPALLRSVASDNTYYVVQGFASRVDFGGHEFRVVSCDFVDRCFIQENQAIHEVTRNNTNQKTLPVLAQYDFWGKAVVQIAQGFDPNVGSLPLV